MKKFLHNLALKFFKKYIRVYQIDRYVSDVEMLNRMSDAGSYHKKEMAFRLADKMIDDGLVEFITENDPKRMGKTLTAKIRVI